MVWRPRSRGTTPAVAPDAPVVPAPADERAVQPPGLREWLIDLLTATDGSAPSSVLVVLAAPGRAERLPEGPERDGVRMLRVWERPAESPDPALVEPVVPAGPGSVWDAVLVVAADRAELRTVASRVPEVGRSRTVALWLQGTPLPVLVPQRGEWPPVAEVQARRLPKPFNGSITALWFTRPIAARGVVHALAQHSVGSQDPGRGQLVVGYVGRPPLPGLDVRATHLPAVRDSVDPALVVAPDLVLVADGVDPADLDMQFDPHPATGRAPVVVTGPAVEPVDELVWNPIGFVKVPDRPSLTLADVRTGAGVTEGFVRRARRARSVRVDLTTAAPQDVLRLAMSGIALEVTGAQHLFAPAVQEALSAPLDLEDHLAREGWTLRVRRAVFDHHSTLAWRAGASAVAGVTRLRTATHGLPPVSVLLATKRADELEGAVRTVAAQVGVEIELVVAAHGFSADPARIAEWLGREAVVLDMDEDAYFGDVLSAAAAAASSNVLMKMDDDDWYSPHSVHDLLMARRYTGADVVGMPAEFVHLLVDGLDETVRRTHQVERFTSFVAGGTLTFSAELLRELGGFRPVRRWVDTQLLHAVLAQGGQVYRTHGLGYVLKRRDEGHTWHNDTEKFRRRETLDRTWPGFRAPEEGT